MSREGAFWAEGFACESLAVSGEHGVLWSGWLRSKGDEAASSPSSTDAWLLLLCRGPRPPPLCPAPFLPEPPTPIPGFSPGRKSPRPQVGDPGLPILVGAPRDGKAQCAALLLGQLHRGDPSELLCQQRGGERAAWGKF